MVPKFKVGDRNGGMTAGVKAVAAVLDGTMEAENESDDGGWMSMLVVLVGILAMAFLVVYRKKSRCPQCGAKTFVHKSTDHFRQGGVRYRKDIYVCTKCGKVVVENTPEDDRDNGNAGAILTGMMLGSMLGRGGRGGSGGSYGGSFGGGSTGGGGAGSSW